MTGPVAEVVSALRAARKYRGLCDATLERVARWALARHQAPAPAIKAAKRKLHQATAAFLAPAAAEALAARAARLPDEDGPALRSACRELLAAHASTAARLGFLDGLYPALWRITGTPRSILDLACGLHPFAWPWMGLDAGTRYAACDVDLRVVGAVGAFLARRGRSGAARALDLLCAAPEEPADVVLLLQALPGLEAQEWGGAARVLAATPARRLVVSLPTATLGGRRAGRRESNDRWLAERLPEGVRAIGRLELPGETFYVLER
jgi:16S rRNA (guanine(1405)-N(7))-methyltransferase